MKCPFKAITTRDGEIYMPSLKLDDGTIITFLDEEAEDVYVLELRKTGYKGNITRHWNKLD